MPETIIAIGIVVLIILVYILTYAINSQTKRPENCDDLECNSCKASNCSQRKDS